MSYSRYAVFYVPPATANWARIATAWLGWDMVAASPVDAPDLAGLPLDRDDITATPRRYGLHATIRPPFALAEGQSRQDLDAACRTLCSTLKPLRLDGLAVTAMGRFLALCPAAPSPDLTGLAADALRALDQFRPPLTPDDIVRRGPGLNPVQQANLSRWGYPHVLDHFRFHLTLTGRLSKVAIAPTRAALDHLLAPHLPPSEEITDLAFVGEDGEGRFHLLHRYALTG